MRSLIEANCKVWEELFRVDELLRQAVKAIYVLRKRMIRKKYFLSEKGRIAIHKKNATESARERVRRYNKTEKGKARKKKYKSKPQVREHESWMQRSRYSSQRLRNKKL